MRNAERYMELLVLAPGWLDLDPGAVVKQQVALQINTGMRGPGIKLQKVLDSTNQITTPEVAVG